MIQPFRFPLFRLLAAGLALSLSSCMENSHVIRVNKDGTGEIWARYYFSPQMAGMLGMAAGLGGGDAAAGAPPAIDANSILNPSRESLAQSAAGYGPEVRYQRHETVQNDAGWNGYLVVYEFDDIGRLKFDPDNLPGPMSEFAKLNPDAVAEAAARTATGSKVGFSMAGGVLTVNTGLSEKTLSKAAEMGAGGVGFPGGGGLPGLEDGAMTGPDGQEMTMQAAIGMAAPMMHGMRMAYFLQIEPGIAETNATHVDGNRITLSDVQPAKAMSDPRFLEFTKAAEAFQEKEADGAALAQMIESLNDLDGIAIETQEIVTVKFQ